MTAIKYNQINGPQKTVNSYLQNLSNEDLQSIYSTSSLYNLSLPGLMKKLQTELCKRNLLPQVSLP